MQKPKTRDEFFFDQVALFVLDGVPLVEARRIAADLTTTVYDDMVDRAERPLCTYTE